ncbi:heat shock 70 kDa protein 12A-like isoform X1 [Mytilus galloprovincialis]|uniref:heat shock 70 kDa protein 12A-like isoform X1 n=1 Tax=Mytilus galloprovincialis TaxID=29158 RepID=UPI003F7C563D
MACEESDNTLLVAAIDFGTTYSGYAFSTRISFKKDKLDIKANQVWNAGSKQLLSLKTPTCILLRKNLEIVSFGYQAENDYAAVVTDETEDDYYFFQQFKMKLYRCENLTLDTPLLDVRRQSLPAVVVFSSCIKALCDHLHQTLSDKGVSVNPDEIKWVLTVPAIWSDGAKQFMRESAKKAGIKNDKLAISLEPEDASIFCQCLSMASQQGFKEVFSKIQKGTKYMVVDLGGGTVDITAHEKLDEHTMVELCKATGDDCGGSSVDKEFLQIFDDIVGKDVMKSLACEEVDSYLDLCRSFETTKRKLEASSIRPKVTITFPFFAIDKLCKRKRDKEFETLLSESKYSQKITLKNDKLIIDLEFMKSLFRKVIDRTIKLIRNTFSNGKARDITTLLLVGGFSECHLVQEEIRKAFSDKTVISPDDPGLAVLKGAVLFGHMPNLIQSRFTRRTYGRRIKPLFNSNLHDRSRLVVEDGEERCEGVFEAFMTANESIQVGTKVKVSYHTIRRRQDKINVAIYVTEEETIPKYVDEKGCRKIGEFVIDIPNPTDERRHGVVQFTFGDTEIKAKAMETESKAVVRAKLNLL